MRGLIGKLCRQTDSRHCVATNANKQTNGHVGLILSASRAPIKQTLTISDPPHRRGREAQNLFAARERNRPRKFVVKF